MPQRNTAAKEPEYGDKVAVETQEEGMEQAAAVAAVQTPTPGAPPMTDEQRVEATGQAAPQGAAPPQGIRIGNPMMLIPPEMNFPQMKKKAPIERKYDAAMLFQVLSKDSPVFSALYREMMGER